MIHYDPNSNHFIEDNFEAAVLIAEQGRILGKALLDKLTPPPGCNSAHHPYEMEHHWCLASFHCGHELDKDNGYMVVMYSKSLISKQDALDAFAYAVGMNTEGNIYVTPL